MSACLFFQMLLCVASLAVYMLGIETSRVLGLPFFVSLGALLTIVVLTLVYCLVAEHISHDLSGIGDMFYQCAWYRLPLHQQRLFIMPIGRGHKVLRMAGLGLIECSLPSFASASKQMNIDTFRTLLMRFVLFVGHSS